MASNYSFRMSMYAGLAFLATLLAAGATLALPTYEEVREAKGIIDSASERAKHFLDLL